MNHTNLLERSDLFGATISGLCSIHCAITPLFLASQPLLDQHAHGHDHGLWGSLDYIFLVLSLVAVVYSSWHTNRPQIKWLLWMSWAVFAIGLVLEMTESVHNKSFMYVGSIALIVTHFANIRHCRVSKRSDS